MTIAKCLWIAGCVAVLVATLYLFDDKPNSDVEFLLVYGMLILAFPISLVLLLFGDAAGYVAYSVSGYASSTNRPGFVITWLFFFIPGYWQWFKLLPRLVGRMRRGNPDGSRT
jgi:hypothetical protein